MYAGTRAESVICVGGGLLMCEGGVIVGFYGNFFNSHVPTCRFPFA
jgi:hypothetical protein